MTTGVYARVSTDRQTSENQFADLLREARAKDPLRDWDRIGKLFSGCIQEEHRPCSTRGERIIYTVNPDIVRELANDCVYVEQGRSSRSGARRRPLFEHMKRDAARGLFQSLLVWKVSRLGRDMREVIATVYELADLGIMVVPIHSQTGPITSTMGRLLWAIQAWYAEMENGERSETIRAGLARAKAKGKRLGRPRVFVSRSRIDVLRASGASWRTIARELGVGMGTVYRALAARSKKGSGGITEPGQEKSRA